jgi:acyl-coenzyme A synthetase/AMP-(fatty) acid ligase
MMDYDAVIYGLKKYPACTSYTSIYTFCTSGTTENQKVVRDTVYTLLQVKISMQKFITSKRAMFFGQHQMGWVVGHSLSFMVL